MVVSGSRGADRIPGIIGGGATWVQGSSGARSLLALPPPHARGLWMLTSGRQTLQRGSRTRPTAHARRSWLYRRRKSPGRPRPLATLPVLEAHGPSLPGARARSLPTEGVEPLLSTTNSLARSSSSLRLLLAPLPFPTRPASRQ